MSTTTSKERVTPAAPRTASAIIVGVDGSNDGLQAVDYATSEVIRRHLDLCIVHVAPHNAGLGIPLPPTVQDLLLGAGHKIAESARERALDRGLARDRISCRVVSGHPGGVLKKLADTSAGLVLGRRSLNGLQRLFTGSVSQSVGAGAQCPVYVVPSGWQPGTGGGAVAVGIDASKSALPVLKQAFIEAEQRGLGLQVVFAWEPPMYNYVGVADYNDALAELTQTAERRIAETVAGYEREYPGVTMTRHFIRQHPVAALEVISSQVELLVLGRSGGGRVSGLGPVSRSVLGSAACPVVVVPNGGTDHDDAAQTD